MKQMNMIQMILGLKHSAAKMTSATAEKLLNTDAANKLTPMSVLTVPECKLSSPDSMNSMAPILEYGDERQADELPPKDGDSDDFGRGDGDGYNTPNSEDMGIQIEIPMDMDIEGEVSIVKPEESACKMATQTTPAFLLAGLGMVGAGLLLDQVQHWDVFMHVKEMFIVTTPLLGLKGNLEMTLASRLSTQANMGTMHNKAERTTCIKGNIILTQCQACILSFLSALVAIIFSLCSGGETKIDNYLVLICSTLVTASVATLLLATITIGVVFLCHKLKLNPDNIATPIAASLGDISTLGILALFGTIFYAVTDYIRQIAPLVIFCFIVMIPVFLYFSYQNPYVKDAVILRGWIPILAAMIISTVGGYVLDMALEHYESLAMFQPVVNGVGGNLVAIQASRISTYLHTHCPTGALPSARSSVCINPFSAFFGSEPHCKTARVLMLFVIPGHVIFAIVLILVKTGGVHFSFAFMVSYLTAVVLQVAILIFLARVIVFLVWKTGRDPDNEAIPYLTSLGDLLGVSFLFLAFTFISSMGSSTY